MGLAALEMLNGELAAGVGAVWKRLAGPGATLDGRQRLACLRTARAAIEGVRGDFESDRQLVAGTVAAVPATIRQPWVAATESRGVAVAEYVEVVSVVARGVAIDTLMWSLGFELEPIPRPVEGAPTGRIAADARLRSAWVPMVGGASITQALSLVPDANAEVERLHGLLYLRYEEMGQALVARGLSRPQMELVAARTSALNQCFY